jgi:hypothetical protein
MDSIAPTGSGVGPEQLEEVEICPECTALRILL